MIHWRLDEKQADYILQVLQTRPFAEVHALIDDLLKQAQSKIPMQQAQPKPPVQQAPDLVD